MKYRKIIEIVAMIDVMSRDLLRDQLVRRDELILWAYLFPLDA